MQLLALITMDMQVRFISTHSNTSSFIFPHRGFLQWKREEKRYTYKELRSLIYRAVLQLTALDTTPAPEVRSITASRSPQIIFTHTISKFPISHTRR